MAASTTGDGSRQDAGSGSNLYRDAVAGLRISVSILTWLSVVLMLTLPIWFGLAAFGTKWGFWDWTFGLGFMIHDWGVPVLLTSAVTGALALVMIGVHAVFARRLFGVITAPLLALLLGLSGLFWTYNIVQLRAATPPLLDVTTDPLDPPHFSSSFTVRRASDEVGLDYAAHRMADGQTFAQIQAVHYPQIQSWTTPDAPDAVYGRAIQAGRFMGWRIGTASQSAGMFEASTESFWFGFRDDVVVRVRPLPDGGSQVDVRSIARDDVHDLGRNAQRVLEFIELLNAGASLY